MLGMTVASGIVIVARSSRRHGLRRKVFRSVAKNSASAYSADPLAGFQRVAGCRTYIEKNREECERCRDDRAEAQKRFAEEKRHKAHEPATVTETKFTSQHDRRA
jgi:hypothetical protein